MGEARTADLTEKLPEGKVFMFERWIQGARVTFGVYMVMKPFSPVEVLSPKDRELFLEKGYFERRPGQYLDELISEGYVKRVDDYTFALSDHESYSTMQIY